MFQDEINEAVAVEEKEFVDETLVCKDCGNECQVPFKPTEGKDVFCSECFAKRRAERV